jgi:hypothetical protein
MQASFWPNNNTLPILFLYGQSLLIEIIRNNHMKTALSIFSFILYMHFTGTDHKIKLDALDFLSENGK